MTTTTIDVSKVFEKLQTINKICGELLKELEYILIDYNAMATQCSHIEKHARDAHMELVRIQDCVERRAMIGKSIYNVYGYLSLETNHTRFRTSVLANSVAEAEEIARRRDIRFIDYVEYCGVYQG